MRSWKALTSGHNVVRITPRYLIIGLPLLFTACAAVADLELTVDTEYPRRLQLKVPVQEDSNFEIRTSFGHGEFFTATGHVGRVTGLTTNRTIRVIYGYEYNLGNSSGSATGSQDQPLSGLYSIRVVSSIWSPNPGFTVREVLPPVSPDKLLTNMTLLTNVTTLTNSTKQPAPPLSSPKRE